MRPHAAARRTVLRAAFVLLALAPAARADVALPAPFGSHMVVQRDRPVRVWGTADAGESVTVEIAGARGAATADASGHFQVTLAALPAGGPHTLVVTGRNRLQFDDVWAGEVWVASGQSNMEWPLQRADRGAADAAAGCDRLRLFTVARTTAFEPRTDVAGSWSACTAETALGFSAVAFHFGLQIARSQGVTVGLVHTSWGGTPAEAWTPRAALTAAADLAPMVAAFDRERADPAAAGRYREARAAWERKNFAQDTGNTGFDQGWASPDADESAWKPLALPQYWEASGLAIDGAVWFRRAFDLPADGAARDLTLSLGPLDDMDVTYVNGVEVGRTDGATPEHWAVPRVYPVPAARLRPGRNVVAVRVWDHAGDGGFAGAPAQMFAQSGETKVPLAGTWLHRVERSLPPATVDWGSQPAAPASLGSPYSPTVLWNAMVAPLVRFPVRGVIWYQGEANTGRAYQYRTLFPAMIRAWREAWADPDLAFLFVQLASFTPGPPVPGESEWAELREAQAMTLALPRTGMATAIDIGESADIHPKNKADVGLRLALAARGVVYGEAVAASGPVLGDSAIDGRAIRVFFKHAAGLATRDGSAPRAFAIAGRDRKWRPATAAIDGETVLVSSPDVPAPVAVRYGWADDPPVNLVNGAGLPALPFRTDDWPGRTTPKGR
ncbi:MAG: sialate O-acetylesterase [Vicinamibacteria bacterium]